MALIAGCQIKNGNISFPEIENTLRKFHILSDDDLDNYDNLVIETQFGYLLRKYKKDYPIQSMPYDDKGNTLLTLGFICSPETFSSPEQLERCEGEFVVILSEPSGKLHIVNDRFGSRPFYISESPNGIYFSSNLAFLLDLVGGNHEPDILGWFHMFSYGHTYGSRTTFKDFKRLLPATHIVISPNGILEQKRYWRLEYTPTAGLDPVSYSQEVFEAFKKGATLRSRVVGRGVVALSGGLDSRLVAAALPHDVEFSAFTFINSSDDATSSPDTEVAAQISHMLGLKHQIDPIPTQEYSEIGKDVIRLTGGMRPLHHSATVMPYIREMKRCGVNFLLGGGPGDVSAGSKIPSIQYLDPSRTNDCVRDFCRDLAGGAEYLSLLFRQEIVKDYQREVYRSLVDSFADIGGPTAAHKVTAWELLNRWPAFTFTSVMHNHPDVSEAFCHLDYKYSDLMFKLPADWLYQRNFYSVMIYNCLPKLRHVPYANTGQLLSSSLQQFEYDQTIKTRTLSVVAQLSRKIIPRKIKRLLKPIPKGTRPLYYYLYKDDTRLLAEIRECLGSSKALREILDSDKCLRFLDSFRNDSPTDLSYDHQTELMGSLATMCLTYDGLTSH